MTAPRHVTLIDGSGFIFRAFHGLPPMTRPDGTPVNAVYGFTTMLMKLLADSQSDHVAVIFDSSRKTFRSEIYPEYKAHRPPAPDELVPQFPLVREATRAFDLPAIELEGFEADDLIATYARLAVEAGASVTIVSSDKDLMQLVGPGVDMYDPMKNRAIGEAEVREKFGVAPDKVVDVQALCGDSSDNVPGVPGIGVKTAAQLIEEYGDLDTLLARASEIKQPKRRESLIEHAELARISRQLVRLRTDAPVPVPLADLDVKPPAPEKLAAFCAAQGFRSLMGRLNAKIPTTAPTATRAIVDTASAEAPSLPPKVESDYELVTDLAALDRWVAQASKAGLVGFDTETTGLDPLRAKLVGVSLALAPGRACYIPVMHSSGEAQGDLLGGPSADAPKLIPAADILARLKPLLADPAVLKVGHNIKYDMQVMAGLGLAIQSFDDTMLLSYVLDGASHGHGLDELCLLHLGHRNISFAEVCGSGRNQVTFDRVPLDKACAYAAEDADMTLRLHGLLKPRLLLERMVSVYETLERPLVPVIAAMERDGIKVDRPQLMALSEDFGRRLTELETEVVALNNGEAFNLGSPQQLGKVLFETLNLPGGKKTKTGQWATGADVLEDLAHLHPLPARLLDWRQLSKLKGTYTDALVAQINPATGRVHTSYALAATTTGRLSSSDPNLQNIPIRTEEGRKIRHAFVAEPGKRLISADYSQIELRLVAHVAEIEGLRDAFADGADIHAITASQVFGVPLDGMDSALRRRAKAINFGIIYGISPFGLAAQLGIPQGEAKAYIEAYFARYPEIRTFMERTKEEAREKGFVTTLFGRKVFTPGIKDKNGAMRAFAERAAINGPIQGGAADIIKRAMIRLPAALVAEGLKARLLLQVHDELVLEAPEDETEATVRVVKRVMEAAATLSVPLLVEAGIADSWDAAH
ncbi:DNA polymerase I [Paramagnetospirillum magnetotacticum MS-1]|uniref:DNA polymerase I n=1 Tax=Paramagnetospirillum magnetotacticum MS-1 TaxID=272627 RepID=A0A0C2YQR8_PARME|nr:DNA polymerase I [Paramagnetospirillum magnetotacticum]KIL97468.1 DNA polymerase I [Paramagnetospirillum magnetotacticum MS-1]